MYKANRARAYQIIIGILCISKETGIFYFGAIFYPFLANMLIGSFYRKGARVVIDGNERKEIREAPGPVLALYLTSSLAIGGSVGHPNKNGFTGCMRAFMLNGRLVDLVHFAKREIYGNG